MLGKGKTSVMVNFCIVPVVENYKKICFTARPTGQVSFPVDFFEHCTHTNDIDFGGNDVLQIYNTNQIKHRLNTTGMYIASTKVSFLKPCEIKL